MKAPVTMKTQADATVATPKAKPAVNANAPVKAAPQPIREGRTCSWPIGDPSKSDFHFCGAKRDAGQSYCAEHISLAYQKGTKRGKTLSHSLSVASRSSARSR
jgi:GcrA cell cycle regulator